MKTKYNHKMVEYEQGRIQDFKLGGAHLKKSCRAEGGAKNFGVFRVKNHDFTTKNRIFSNCGGRRENFWGISCEKSFADRKFKVADMTRLNFNIGPYGKNV
jgi:hypothetical protein